MKEKHGKVVARMGDKLWDVAHMDAMRGGNMSHVADKDCYIFRDPRLNSCVSVKLPGHVD